MQRATGIQSAIRQMEVGHGMVAKMDEYKRVTVTTAASLAGREIGGKFSVHCDWDNRKYIITRIA